MSSFLRGPSPLRNGCGRNRAPSVSPGTESSHSAASKSAWADNSARPPDRIRAAMAFMIAGPAAGRASASGSGTELAGNPRP
eukprot:323798-Hanusia_phi.AAC.2